MNLWFRLRWAGVSGCWRLLALLGVLLDEVPAVVLGELPGPPSSPVTIVDAIPEPQWLAPGIGIISHLSTSAADLHREPRR